MNNLIMTIAEQIPATGDSAPIKAALVIGGIAVVILVVTTIIAKKKK